MGGLAIVAAVALGAFGLGELRAEDTGPVGPSATLRLGAGETVLAAPFDAELTVRVPPGWTVPGEGPGPVLGDASVLEGAWEAPREENGTVVRRWKGRMAAYRLGEVTVPPIRVSVLAPDGSSAQAVAEGSALTVRGALPPEETGQGAEPVLSDLKPPATVPPDYRRLLAALAILAGVAAAAGAAWWAHRRWAGRLAGVPVDLDPFRRMAPDAWAYEALRQLLDGRWAEEGREDLFHAELARIVKQYLSGRFRVDLMERTTGEVGEALRQAGIDPGSAAEAVGLLERADLAKFARALGGIESCRLAVEEAYGIVDRTRPLGEPGERGEAA